jgi:TM2 domain-containing membrane protein YozV
MKKTLIVILLGISICVFAQDKEQFNYSMTGLKLNSTGSLHNSLFEKHYLSQSTNISGTKIKNNIVIKSKKSPGLAFLMSLIVPGTGQLYAGRFDVGKYFMISEASLWLTYISFTIYGNWLLNDAYNFAVIHAGIDKNGKSDQFFLDIANWDNVTEYNNDKLSTGQYNLLYYPENGWGFYWDQVSNRKIYREDKLAADRIKNDRLFIIGAVLVNHVISAISAIFVTNKYNNELNKSGGYTINADVMKFRNRADGIKLKLTKWF